MNRELDAPDFPCIISDYFQRVGTKLHENNAYKQTIFGAASQCFVTKQTEAWLQMPQEKSESLHYTSMAQKTLCTITPNFFSIDNHFDVALS